ncbi:hypothetical protein EMEDMD4_790331 [Sinorhizobium medicae]|uniref:Uncharacterized protein n=1 Tax=Sinorhizobium medicae TaxID=110321 RepID=A0A508WWV4_9HYPH|nr:hypothetical protein [Sinorhizobium medicae]VTZ60141.1 hypothetical protein EMEDMD4_1330019 [Sinorhizobium medicae]VTZ65307.1 hypothetical protein EMEDMD4_790331 [Sinorhizobium medicae]
MVRESLVILQILLQDDGAHPVALELVWHKNAHRTGGDLLRKRFATTKIDIVAE